MVNCMSPFVPTQERLCRIVEPPPSSFRRHSVYWGYNFTGQAFIDDHGFIKKLLVREERPRNLARSHAAFSSNPLYLIFRIYQPAFYPGRCIGRAFHTSTAPGAVGFCWGSVCQQPRMDHFFFKGNSFDRYLAPKKLNIIVIRVRAARLRWYDNWHVP